MTVNVLNQWLESGASDFIDITQAILRRRNTQLSTQIGAFSPNQPFGADDKRRSGHAQHRARSGRHGVCLSVGEVNRGTQH